MRRKHRGAVVVLTALLFGLAAPHAGAAIAYTGHMAYAERTEAPHIDAAVYAVENETPTTGIGDVSDAMSTVDVEDIEIDDHKDVISVDETLELAVTVLPVNATEQTVSYESSDEKVITVDSKGKVKGIAPGKATVTISVGGLTKRVSIKVRETTEYIDVDTDYLIMKTGEVHTVRAKAVPGGASQDISYKSLSPRIAKVTKTGVIKARATGSASIIVSNDEMSVGITVIVNKGSASPSRGGKKDSPKDSGGEAESDTESDEEYAALVSYIDDSGGAALSVSDYPALTTEMLAAIYAANAYVKLSGADYTMRISGGDIVNTENELATVVTFLKNPDGVEFLLNRGHNLPGRVKLSITDKGLIKKYVYLYNNAKKKYELLDVKDGDSLVLDAGGKYLMADEKIDGLKINRNLIAIASAAVAVVIIIFIILKRRYWFW
jgi:hypothetical protein